jgi:hypothetical protein
LGLEQDPSGGSVPTRVQPRPVCIHSCSPLRRRPDAATWTTARDVSQRTEPGVKPLGYTAPAFIADKTSAYPFQWQATCSSLLARYQGKRSPLINTPWTAAIMAPDDYSGVISINYPHNVFHPLCSWAHMSGLSTLVCASLKL